jgi:hypothetical protein
MTLNELIERLEEYKDELGGEAEVRLMTQQNWPFENAITGLVSGTEINESDEDDDACVEDDAVVYIVEGTQLIFGSMRAWVAAQYRRNPPLADRPAVVRRA